MKRAILLFFVLLLLVPVVFADNLTLSLDQNDFYFSLGEDSRINLHSENTYGQALNGLLTYTITQNVQQGNLQYSNTNSQSTSFSVEDGTTIIPISFGTSNNPVTLDIGLQFSFTKDEERVVTLDDFRIHFVSNSTQQQSTGSGTSSTSQKASAASPQQNDPFAQQKQQMQQMVQQMMGNQQSSQQSVQQRMENNQISQDSNALKQQMAQQLQEQQAMKKAFQQELSKNDEFQQEHQNLLNQGYNLTGGSLDPSANDTGDFSLQYQKPSGEQASLSGSMRDGKMESIQQESAESQKKMMKQLRQDERFQKYDQQLQEEGFQQQDVQFSTASNTTNVQATYQNELNETANISATIENETVEEVRLEKNEERRKQWWLIPTLLLIVIAVYILYRRRRKLTLKPEKKKIEEPPFDHQTESLKLIERAKERFAAGEHKDAYGLAGQAIRLFLNHEHGLKKEVTSDEIITFLRLHRKAHKQVKEALDLSSLVEFAKYKANKKDFDKIILIAEKLVGTGTHNR